MKNLLEKLTMAFSVFSPIIVLVFICCAYLCVPQRQKVHVESGQTKKPERHYNAFKTLNNVEIHS